MASAYRRLSSKAIAHPQNYGNNERELYSEVIDRVIMQTDLSHINFKPFPGVAGLDVCVFDVDLKRQIVDAVFRFPANETVALHRHVSQTNMLILSGELIIYDDDGSVRDRRTAGHYFTGTQDDVHIEGGGPDGAVVFYLSLIHISEPTRPY